MTVRNNALKNRAFSPAVMLAASPSIRTTIGTPEMEHQTYESNPRLAKLAAELGALNRLAVKIGLSDEQKLSLLRTHCLEVSRHETQERTEERSEHSAWHRPGVDYQPTYF